MTRQMIEAFAEEGIIRVRISMAPPLRWVNSYILRGKEGITIVDPGPRTAQTEDEWHTVWSELDISPRDVVSIVLTHHHPDHYGLAGYMQLMTGAEVLMSRRAHEETLAMWGEQSRINEALQQLYGQHGMPDLWLKQLPGHMESFISQVTPAPAVTYLTEADRVTMGGHNWTVIETAGHAPGHLSFYDSNRRLMLCGDAVLPQISPNISYLPGSDPEPLRAFMESLVKLKLVEVDKAFPGHRNPFSNFRERTEALIDHHEDRLNQIHSLLAQSHHSGFDICAALFGTELGIHQMRFAMSETLAHIYELIRREQAIVMTKDSKRIVFGKS